MYKKLVLLIFSLISFFFLAPISSAFAADQVQVSLPSFTVTLNGQTTGNDYSKYPLIVYKNITYFPMTYYDCRLLGLKTDWTNDTGLIIEKNEDYFYEYMREVNDNKNASKQIAKIAADKITVNGNVIDNSTEEYPLLVFRDVTYFPLTWRFAVNEFGCNYTFDQKNGLVIQNDNVKLENPDEWEGLIEPWGSVMGIANVSLPVNFIRQNETASLHAETSTEYQPIQSRTTEKIGLYNCTGKDITILPTDFRWEYQVYRIVNQKEELVYRKNIPFYEGPLPKQQYAIHSFTVSYWNREQIQRGTYKIRLTHPVQLTYQEMENKKTSTSKLEEGYGSFFFEGLLNVK